jgi:hypothetical protein
MLIYAGEIVEHDNEVLEFVDLVPSFAAAPRSLSKGGGA